MIKNNKLPRRRAFRNSLIVSVLIAAAMLTGCGSNNGNQTIQMYYLTGEGYSLTTDSYKIKSPENTDDAVSQVLEEIAGESSRGATRALFNSEVSINGAVVAGNTVTVDFSKGYYSMDKVEELVARAGIVKTLTQIEGIDNVIFTVEGTKLTNSKGEEIGPMNADTFVDNSGRKDDPAAEEESVPEESDAGEVTEN